MSNQHNPRPALNICAFKRLCAAHSARSWRYVGPDLSDFGGPCPGDSVTRENFTHVFSAWRAAQSAYLEFFAVASSARRLAGALEVEA